MTDTPTVNASGGCADATPSRPPSPGSELAVDRANLDSDDFYDNLGVDHDVRLMPIKLAYRKLAVKYHPEKNHDNGADVKFAIVSQAYIVLSDAELRRKYDLFGKDGLYEHFRSRMSTPVALHIFNGFVWYSDKDEAAPITVTHGMTLATVGALCAPLYGAASGGVALVVVTYCGATAVANGLGDMVGSMREGIKEMRDARAHALVRRHQVAATRRDDRLAPSTPSSTLDATHVTTPSGTPTGDVSCTSNEKAFSGETRYGAHDANSIKEVPYVPTFLGGLRKATIGAVAKPAAGLMDCTLLLAWGSLLATGLVLGGISDGAHNVASGVREVGMARRMTKKRTDETS